MSITTRNQRNEDRGDEERHGVRLMVPAMVAAAASAIALYGGLRSASDMAHTFSDVAVHDAGKVVHVAEADDWVRPRAIFVEPPRLDDRTMDLDDILIRPARLPAPPRLTVPDVEAQFTENGAFLFDRPAVLQVRAPETEDVEFDESLAPADLERPRVPALPPIEPPSDN